MLALVSANLIICISTIYPLFSTVQCHIEYAAPTLRETIESPLALVCSGPTPSVIQVSSEPSGGRKKLFFLAYIVCMREARPSLSMKKTPAWYRVPLSPPPHTHIGVEHEWDTPVQRALPAFLAHGSSHSLSCSPTCLTKTLNYKQTNMCKSILLAFCSPVPNWVFLFPVRCVSTVGFFPERHTKLQEWDFIKLPYLGRSLLLPLNYRIFSNQSR